MLWSSLATLLAQAAPTTTPTDGPWYNSAWFLLAVAVATLVIPYLVGNAIAKALRMPDYGWKIGLILIALTAGIVIDAAGWPPKRGIDLSGGVKLVYEIDQEKLQEVNVDEIIRRVAEEANKAGPFKKSNQAKVVTSKAGTIEVRLPTTDPQRVQKVKAALGALDLSNLSASLSGPQERQEDQQTVLEYQAVRSSKAPAIDMDKLISAVSKRINPGGNLEVAIRRLGNDQIEVDIPDVDQTEIELIKRKIATAGALEFHIVADQRAPQDADVIEAARRQIANPSNDVSNGQMIVGRWVDVAPNVRIQSTWLTRPAKSGLQVLMDMDGFGVTGSDLTSASTANGIKGPQVEFQFNSKGADKFGELTGTNTPKENGLTRELGIVLDGELKSAATIQSKITFSGEITGDFTEAEVDFIVGVLNAGQLPAALKKEPISQESISAELGRDTIHSSAMAMIVSGLSVLVFMLFYYRFAGIVADAAVLFNLLLVLAFMIVLKSAFTLAGLAGLVLSIGMAVDSNVLIYERMREEKERGAALRMVIRNGFGRAMATIIDMHSTTIITGLVLYFIGTDQLRGFAVTLVLGLLVNLFTAVFCARVVFDVAERQRWLTKLKMLRLFGDTKIDFVRIMVPAIIISVLISVLGVAAAWHRSVVGPGMFDTDFTGGTVVQIVLKTPMNDAEVRKLVEGEQKYLPDSTVVAVEGKENLQFIIRTSNQQPQEVEDELTKLFGAKLQTYGIGELKDLHAITATKPAESKPAEAKPAEVKPAAAKPGETKGAEPKATDSKTEPKTETPKASDSKNGTEKASDSKASDNKAPDSKASDSTGTSKGDDSKTNESKGDAGKSSALPVGGARSSSLVSELLKLAAGTDVLFVADPPAAVPSTDTKAADTKSADTKAPTAAPPATNGPTVPAPTAPAPTTPTPTVPAPTAPIPSTAGPTTPAPTTPAPTTPAPTTPAPTTPAPTTPAPTTPAPTTPAPTTPAPTTPAPTTPAPTTPAPTTPAASTPTPTVPVSATPIPSTAGPTTPVPTTPTPTAPVPTTTGPNTATPITTPPDTKTSGNKTPERSPPPTKESGGDSTGTSIFTQSGPTTGPDAFVGGTETTLNFGLAVPYDGVESLVSEALGRDVRFELTNPNYHPGDKESYSSWTLRVALPPDVAGPRLEKFRESLAKKPAFLGVSNIGGRVAGDTQTTALYALVASIAMIVIYIWIRFQNVIYGVGAVVALIHDVFITVAALAISSYVAPYLGFALVEPFKISLNVVAAILTICGYSISDTIVIFDRIREVRGKSPDLTPEIINLSVNQTLSRTVLTVFTVLLVTTILYISGGQAIHAFAFTMLVGLISGTYSSVYIAAPCLLWMRGNKNQGTTRIQ